MLNAVPADKLETVAERWQQLDEYVAKKAYIARLRAGRSNRRFYSDRINFGTCRLQPVVRHRLHVDLRSSKWPPRPFGTRVELGSRVSEENAPAGIGAVRARVAGACGGLGPRSRSAGCSRRIVVVCLLAPVYAKHVAQTTPSANHLTDQVARPRQAGPTLSRVEGIPIGPTWHGHFFLGADSNGRDVAVRLLYGGRNSLEIAAVATLITMILATIGAEDPGLVGESPVVSPVSGRRTVRAGRFCNANRIIIAGKARRQALFRNCDVNLIAMQHEWRRLQEPRARPSGALAMACKSCTLNPAKTLQRRRTSTASAKSRRSAMCRAKMHAWAIRKERHGPPETSMQLEVVPTWPIGEDEVLVYVMAAGVNYNGVWAGLGMPISPLDVPQESVPHRGLGRAGVVWAIGSKVQRWKVGDEVIVHCNQDDGDDEDCNGGDPMLSPSQRIWGYETPDGSFAQFCRVQSRQLMPKPAASDLGRGGLLHADARDRLPHAVRPRAAHAEARRLRAGLGRLGRARRVRRAARRRLRRQRDRRHLRRDASATTCSTSAPRASSTARTSSAGARCRRSTRPSTTTG